MSELTGSAQGSSLQEFAPTEIREQVTRILESKGFRDAPMQRRLLAHLVEETLSGNPQELKEYSLGVAVFGRGPDFEPRSDSIVRVQVGVLRKKLAAYYEGPGSSDQVVVHVPRGKYVAMFERPRSGHPAAPTDARRVISFRDLTVGVVTGAVLCAAVFLLIMRSAGQPPAPGFEWRRHPLWQGFFDQESSTQLIIGAPTILNVGGLYLRDSRVNDPAETAESPALTRVLDLFQSEPRPIEIYTGLGESAGVYTLGRFFESGGKDLPLVRNRLVRWHDVARGNLVLLSSFRFHTLNEELSLPHEFDYDLRSRTIVNHRVGPGERANYIITMDAGGASGTDYGLISVWPSPQPGRRIMLISGSYTWGTQGAAEYVVDGPSLRRLQNRLEADRPAPDAGLQVLVEIMVKDNQPAAFSYVTHHWLAAQ